MPLEEHFNIAEAAQLLGRFVTFKKAMTTKIGGKTYNLVDIGVTADIVHIIKEPDVDFITLGLLIERVELEDFTKKQFWEYCEVHY